MRIQVMDDSHLATNDIVDKNTVRRVSERVIQQSVGTLSKESPCLLSLSTKLSLVSQQSFPLSLSSVFSTCTAVVINLSKESPRLLGLDLFCKKVR